MAYASWMQADPAQFGPAGAAEVANVTHRVGPAQPRRTRRPPLRPGVTDTGASVVFSRGLASENNPQAAFSIL